MTIDTERLNWLEKQDGHALISDDNGNWAISGEGMQDIPDDPPGDMWTSFCIEKHAWKPTIREAIDEAMKGEA